MSSETMAATTTLSLILHEWLMQPLQEHWHENVVVQYNDVYAPALQEVYDIVSLQWQLLLIQLQVAETAEYHFATTTAAKDVWTALQSVGHWLFLVGRPIVLAFYFTTKYIVTEIIWKLVLQKGLYQQGLKHAVALGRAVYEFERSLTVEQWCWQAGILLSAVVLYHLRKFLQRQTYAKRTVLWFRRQKSNVQKRYRRTARSAKNKYQQVVRKIAQTSLFLAAMIPHVAFAVLAVGSVMTKWLLTSSPLEWLAMKTSMTFLLSWCYPFVSTVWLLYDWQEYANAGASNQGQDGGTKQGQQNNDPDASDKNQFTTPRARRRSLLFPRTTPRQQSEESVINTPATPSVPARDPKEVMQENAQHWLHYWLVYATLQAMKVTIRMIPIAGRFLTSSAITNAALQMELLFYVYLHVLPAILPSSVGGLALPETRPAVVASRRIGMMAMSVHEHVASAIPAEKWQVYVVDKLSVVFGAFCLIRALKRETADWMLHAVQEARVLVIPGISLLMPGTLTAYGCLYVQFLLPLSKSAAASTDSERVLQLRYWILHCLTQQLLWRMAGVLWWIPLSTHAIFLWWAYLTLPATVETYYHAFCKEVACLSGGLLLAHEGVDLVALEHTRTGRLVSFVLSTLPSAVDEKDFLDKNASVNAEAKVVTDSSPVQEKLPVRESTNDDSDDSVPLAKATAVPVSEPSEAHSNEIVTDGLQPVVNDGLQPVINDGLQPVVTDGLQPVANDNDEGVQLDLQEKDTVENKENHDLSPACRTPSSNNKNKPTRRSARLARKSDPIQGSSPVA